MATSVIEKIAKLRRLATSTNVHEAAAAAAAADRLMQEHGIAEAQLEAAGELPKESPVDERSSPLAFWPGQVPSWQMRLGADLTSHYGCAGYITRTRRETGHMRFEYGQALNVVGRPSDIASVRYMYAWLVVEIERIAQLNAGNGRSWLNSFRLGAVAGVIDAMSAERNAVMREARSAAVQDGNANASAALVLVDNRAKEALSLRNVLHPALLKSNGKPKKGRSTGGPSDRDGFNTGHEAGSRLGANHKGLQGGATRALKG